MKIVTRYILTEFIPTFIICFLFFFVMYIINHLLVNITPLIQKKIPGDLIFLILVTIFPLYTMFSLPFSLLLATLMTIGRFSSDNEIVAFRALGFNHIRIFGPIFIFGIVIMLFAFFINDRLRPIGMQKQLETMQRISRIKPTLYFKSKTFKTFSGKTIFTEQVDDKSIDGLIIIDRDNDNQKRIISTKKAEFTTPEGMQDIIEISMKDAMIQFDSKDRPAEYNYGYSSMLSYYLKFNDFNQASSSGSSSELKTILDLVKSVNLYSDRVKKEKYEKEISLMDKKADLENQIIIHLEQSKKYINPGYLKSNLNSYDKKINEYVTLKTKEIRSGALRNNKMNLYRKFALPVACLVFVIFGTPIGVFSKRSGYAFGFIIGLLLCGIYWFAYYGLIIMGRKDLVPPFLAIFLPNIVFFVIGMFLLLRRMRE